MAAAKRTATMNDRRRVSVAKSVANLFFVALLCCPSNVLVGAYSLDDPRADHMKHAIDMDTAGNSDAALKSFAAAVRFHPHDFRNRHNLAVAFMRIGHKMSRDVRDVDVSAGAVRACVCVCGDATRRDVKQCDDVHAVARGAASQTTHTMPWMKHVCLSALNDDARWVAVSGGWFVQSIDTLD